MGKVVKLEPATKAQAAAQEARRAMAARGVGRPGSIDRRRRPRRDKTALVLGGGGFTGGVYEIGALRALDLLAVNSTVNQFDVYVGTSAGAFIAALCANGVTPEEMMRVVTRQGTPPFKDIDLGDLLQPEPASSSRARARCCRCASLSLARQVVSQRGQVSLMDVAAGPRRGPAVGRSTRAPGSSATCARCSSEPGRTDDFRELACELYLTATDLDTCERVVFGADGSDDVPISTAVRASGALPMVYAPVQVDDRELIDGGIVSTTNLDIAVEAGREAGRRDQPDRAVRQRLLRARSARCAAARPRRVSDMGFPQIGYQAFKLRRPPAPARAGQDAGRSATRAWTSC